MTSPKKILEVEKESTLFADLSHIEVSIHPFVETNSKAF
jgi:hypothetical protein